MGRRRLSRGAGAAGVRRPRHGGVAKNWVYTAAEALAVGICAARACARREDRWAWGLITFGLLSWTAGDLVWTLWLNNLATPPFPSIADPLYLAMYPVTYVACARPDPEAPRAAGSGQRADDASVLAHGLQPVLAGLPAEPAVHRHPEI